MKTAFAHYPLVASAPAHSSAKPGLKLSAKAKQQLIASTCKALVCVSGIAMMYCLISYGRIYQNYLQW